MQQALAIVVNPAPEIPWREYRERGATVALILVQHSGGNIRAKYAATVEGALAHGFTFIGHVVDPTKPLDEAKLHRYNPRSHWVAQAHEEVQAGDYVAYDGAWFANMDISNPAYLVSGRPGYPEPTPRLPGYNYADNYWASPEDVARFPQRTWPIAIADKPTAIANPGDTVYKIASAHNLSFARFCALNGMSQKGARVKIGQRYRLA